MKLTLLCFASLATLAIAAPRFDPVADAMAAAQAKTKQAVPAEQLSAADTALMAQIDALFNRLSGNGKTLTAMLDSLQAAIDQRQVLGLSGLASFPHAGP